MQPIGGISTSPKCEQRCARSNAHKEEPTPYTRLEEHQVHSDLALEDLREFGPAAGKQQLGCLTRMRLTVASQAVGEQQDCSEGQRSQPGRCHVDKPHRTTRQYGKPNQRAAHSGHRSAYIRAQAWRADQDNDQAKCERSGDARGRAREPGKANGQRKRARTDKRAHQLIPHSIVPRAFRWGIT